MIALPFLSIDKSLKLSYFHQTIKLCKNTSWDNHNAAGITCPHLPCEASLRWRKPESPFLLWRRLTPSLTSWCWRWRWGRRAGTSHRSDPASAPSGSGHCRRPGSRTDRWGQPPCRRGGKTAWLHDPLGPGGGRQVMLYGKTRKSSSSSKCRRLWFNINITDTTATCYISSYNQPLLTRCNKSTVNKTIARVFKINLKPKQHNFKF